MAEVFISYSQSADRPSRVHAHGVAEDLLEVFAASLSFDDRWPAVAAGRGVPSATDSRLETRCHIRFTDRLSAETGDG